MDYTEYDATSGSRRPGGSGLDTIPPSYGAMAQPDLVD